MHSGNWKKVIGLLLLYERRRLHLSCVYSLRVHAESGTSSRKLMQGFLEDQSAIRLIECRWSKVYDLYEKIVIHICVLLLGDAILLCAHWITSET